MDTLLARVPWLGQDSLHYELLRERSEAPQNIGQTHTPDRRSWSLRVWARLD
jgi:hypothetical protein